MSYIDMNAFADPPVIDEESPACQMPGTPGAPIIEQPPQCSFPGTPDTPISPETASGCAFERPPSTTVITEEPPQTTFPGDPQAPIDEEEPQCVLPSTPAQVSPQVPPCGVPSGIVVNGDFELPDVTGGQTFTAGQSFAGWFVESGSVRVFDATDGGNVPIEGQSLRLVADGSTVDQDVVTEVGKQYQLTAQFRNADGGADTPTGFSMSAKGTSMTEEVHYTQAGTASIVFTADSASTKITLQWTPGVPSANPVVDNVRIY